MNRRQFQEAIDAGLSGLTVTPSKEQALFAAVKGETVVKKKISVGLVLAIVLVLAVATALAVTVLTEYYENTIAMEAENGPFEEWSSADKVQLVVMTLEAGIELDKEKTSFLLSGSLSEEEMDKLATELITDYYGLDHEGYITALSIMKKEKGPFGMWPTEDQAWFSDMQQRYNHKDKNGTWATYTIPGEGDISREEAVTIGKEILQSMYGLTLSEINTYREETTFEIARLSDDGEDEGQVWKQWNLLFYPENTDMPYFIELMNDGEYIASFEPYVPGDRIWEQFMALEQEKGKSFRNWSIEEKASFSKDWNTLLITAQANGEPLGKQLLALSEVEFGLPEDVDITIEDANNYARKALVDEGFKEEDFELYSTYSSFLITDPDKPEWRIAYRISDILKDMDRVEDGEISYGKVILIDARTGELISISDIGVYDPFF